MMHYLTMALYVHCSESKMNKRVKKLIKKSTNVDS